MKLDQQYDQLSNDLVEVVRKHAPRLSFQAHLEGELRSPIAWLVDLREHEIDEVIVDLLADQYNANSSEMLLFYDGFMNTWSDTEDEGDALMSIGSIYHNSILYQLGVQAARRCLRVWEEE